MAVKIIPLLTLTRSQAATRMTAQKRRESSQRKFLHIKLKHELSHISVQVKYTVTLTVHFPSTLAACLSFLLFLHSPSNFLFDGVFVSCLICLE